MKKSNTRKAKYRITDIHFDDETAHVAYTTEATGGAASLKNDAYLFKALTKEDPKTKELEMEKVKQLEAQVAELTKALATKEKEQRIQNHLAALNKSLLSDDTQKLLARALADSSEDIASVVIAAINEQQEAGEKEKEEAVDDAVEKAKASADEKQEDENDVAKSLSAEKGHSKEQKQQAMSLKERVELLRAEQNK